ncbi:MAG: SDR family oxidoreductase, partial [Chitinophagaceae bacterium]|nr:SDR family oxidoreductase [Chitinophagaceae bacterium]
EMLRDSLALSADPAAVLRECEQMHPAARIADPAEIASLIHYLLDDKAAFITGQAIRIDGGLGLMIQGTIKE